MSRPFGFADVVGQDDAKLALLLGATDPHLGGVLLRGEKGSAKTTLARALAGLLGGAPFVELPLSATEDRVVGTLDVAAALGGGEVRFRPGLLADAHGGVLYVDEINLLADHLVDVLLDVAVSGENRVERDGLAHRHPARFVLVGSMNPEEGELRPQLLDRFGLCVEVAAPGSVEDRVEAVRRRLAHDGAPLAAAAAPRPGEVGQDPSASLRSVHPAALGDEVLVAASRLAVEVGAEGLRADLALCRAAAAAAALEGRDVTTTGDLRRVAPLVLAHRSRRRPFDPPGLDPERLDDALSRALHQDDRRVPEPEHTGGDTSGSPPEPSSPMAMGATRRPPLPPPPTTEAARGRYLRSVPADKAPGAPPAVVATARTVAARRAAGDDGPARPEDLQAAVHARPASRLVVLCVDLSGSMGAEERARAATGTALGLLTHAYQRRHRVAVVGFRGDAAELLLGPTSSVEVARNRLSQLRTGGQTPLADGIRLALDLATARHPATAGPGDDPLLVLLTDGRATGTGDPVADALTAADEVRQRRVASLVIDCETGRHPLGLAARVAAAMGGAHVTAASLEPGELAAAITTVAAR